MTEIASLKLFGLRMELDPDDGAISPHLREGEWEPVETALLLVRLREGDTFVDVGAHMGYFTLLASKLVGPEGRVFAFEPNPKVFGYLERNVALNGLANVIAQKKAVFSESREIPFWPEDVGNTGDSQIFNDPNRPRISVAAVALDEEFPPGTRVDFLKSDAQGAEHYVFRGARRLIRDNPQIAMMFEYAPELFRKRELPGEEIWDYLAGEGFTVRIPSRLSPAVSKDEFLRFANFLNLYCRRERG